MAPTTRPGPPEPDPQTNSTPSSTPLYRTPSRAEVFSSVTSAPPVPSRADPRVSLRPTSPTPPSSSDLPSSEPQTLSAFRDSEGSAKRLSRLRKLFDSIPAPSPPSSPAASTSALPDDHADAEDHKREEMRKLYAKELWKKCSGEPSATGTATTATGTACATGAGGGTMTAEVREGHWTAFERYAEEKERELWKVFVELDVDGDMRLKKGEVREACKRAGVEVKEAMLDEFVRAVDKNNDGVISFDEWRDFLLLLPRQTSISEIFRYYQTHRLNRPSMSQLTQDGDVVVGRGKSGWNKLLGKPAIEANQKAAEAKEAAHQRKLEQKNEERRWAEEVRKAQVLADSKGKGKAVVEDVAGDDEDGEEDEPHAHGMFHGAGKFLLAGGVAGAVSRTATAPFDRLKVYLITTPSAPIRPPIHDARTDSTGDPKKRIKPPRRNAGSIPAAVRAVWKQGGGISSFWTGNGLNVVKIFPESAIKFLSYESAKRVFAEYWDKVPDQTMISNTSRFVAGGIGGVVSQFVIYPIETLKTRVMSSTGGALKGNALIARTAIDMWRTGGISLYFRGLPAGLIGVFPYSAIDMSTFEGIKIAYTRWAGQEPGIPGSLAFGAFSGGVGATSVYPLNLVRTRLQAQGTPAHPQVYAGVRDAATQCYKREGWRGFYKGLTPTLVKVVPAVAISYAVYDASKKVLFGQEDPETMHDNDPDAEES